MLSLLLLLSLSLTLVLLLLLLSLLLLLQTSEKWVKSFSEEIYRPVNFCMHQNY